MPLNPSTLVGVLDPSRGGFTLPPTPLPVDTLASFHVKSGPSSGMVTSGGGVSEGMSAGEVSSGGNSWMMSGRVWPAGAALSPQAEASKRALVPKVSPSRFHFMSTPSMRDRGVAIQGGAGIILSRTAECVE